MKKLTILVALILCVTIGGVYATRTYSGAPATTSHKHVTEGAHLRLPRLQCFTGLIQFHRILLSRFARIYFLFIILKNRALVKSLFCDKP